MVIYTVFVSRILHLNLINLLNMMWLVDLWKFVLYNYVC